MRKNTGTVTGEVLINGTPREKHHLHLTAYVSQALLCSCRDTTATVMVQDDVFVPSLTCLETLEFYSGLMMHNGSRGERRSRIQDVFEELDLLDHQQTLV